MKWLILHFLSFITSSLGAQKLPPGEYSTRQPIGSVMFILKDSSHQFYWVADNCYMGITGMGKWEQTGRKIIFNFLPIIQPAVINRQPVIEKKVNEDGNFIADVQLVDAGDTSVKPIGLAIVQRGTKNGVITDSTGEARLQITGTQAMLIISGPGYESSTIYLKEHGNWSVTVYMQPAKPIFIPEGSSEYRIITKNKKYVELQNCDKKAHRQTNRFYYRKQTNEQTEAYIRH